MKYLIIDNKKELIKAKQLFLYILENNIKIDYQNQYLESIQSIELISLSNNKVKKRNKSIHNYVDK